MQIFHLPLVHISDMTVRCHDSRPVVILFQHRHCPAALYLSHNRAFQAASSADLGAPRRICHRDRIPVIFHENPLLCLTIIRLQTHIGVFLNQSQ